MKKLITLCVCAGMMLLLATSAFAPPQGPDANSSQTGGMALLEESHALMKELATADLPLGNVGEQTQQKEQKIVKNMDDLIQLILDQDAEEVDDEGEKKDSDCPSCQESEKEQSDPQNSGKQDSQEQPGQASGQQAETTQAQSNTPSGNPTGEKFDDSKNSAFEGTKADEWGLLPEREYKEIRSATRTEVPKGYDELLERFRRTMAREGARLPK